MHELHASLIAMHGQISIVISRGETANLSYLNGQESVCKRPRFPVDITYLHTWMPCINALWNCCSIMRRCRSQGRFPQLQRPSSSDLISCSPTLIPYYGISMIVWARLCNHMHATSRYMYSVMIMKHCTNKIW